MFNARNLFIAVGVVVALIGIAALLTALVLDQFAQAELPGLSTVDRIFLRSSPRALAKARKLTPRGRQYGQRSALFAAIGVGALALAGAILHFALP